MPAGPAVQAEQREVSTVRGAGAPVTRFLLVLMGVMWPHPSASRGWKNVSPECLRGKRSFVSSGEVLLGLQESLEPQQTRNGAEKSAGQQQG